MRSRYAGGGLDESLRCLRFENLSTSRSGPIGCLVLAPMSRSSVLHRSKDPFSRKRAQNLRMESLLLGECHSISRGRSPARLRNRSTREMCSFVRLLSSPLVSTIMLVHRYGNPTETALQRLQTPLIRRKSLEFLPRKPNMVDSISGGNFNVMVSPHFCSKSAGSSWRDRVRSNSGLQHDWMVRNLYLCFRGFDC
jgi:hypothetical protein